MFGVNSVNGNVQWLGVPDFLRTDRPPWTANILAPHPIWGDQVSSTNPNLGSQSVGDSNILSVPWNRHVRVYTVYHQRIFENMCSAVRRVYDDILRENCTARMQIPST